MSNSMGVRLAWALGLAGLIPFIAGALAVCMPSLGLAQAGGAATFCNYAACILSFLSGVRWGADGRRTERADGGVLALSVLPALVAWIATLTGPFTGYRWTFVILIAAFAIQGAWDMRSAALPDWMGRLRALLTLGALGSLMAALIAT